MKTSASFINLGVGVVAFLSNVFIASVFGFEIYGKFAVILLCQSFGTIFFDLGYSNVIVQQSQVSWSQLKIIEVFANICVCAVTILFYLFFEEQPSNYIYILLILWSIFSVRTTRNVALMQRARKISQIVYGDGIQVVTFILLLFSSGFGINTDSSDQLITLMCFQICSNIFRVFYTQFQIRDVIVCLRSEDVEFSISATKNFASSQILDRLTRIFVSKSEQILFSSIFVGEQLGLFLFLSNTSTQLLSRLLSPMTRHIVAISKDKDISSVVCEIRRMHLRFFYVLGAVLLLGVSLFAIFHSKISELDEKFLLLIDNVDIFIIFLIISIVRFDLDFYTSFLVSARRYFIIPIFNISIAFVVISILLISIYINMVVAALFACFVGLCFKTFEAICGVQLQFWRSKSILLVIVLILVLLTSSKP